jgi:hypothetical protein
VSTLRPLPSVSRTASPRRARARRYRSCARGSCRPILDAINAGVLPCVLQPNLRAERQHAPVRRNHAAAHPLSAGGAPVARIRGGAHRHRPVAGLGWRRNEPHRHDEAKNTRVTAHRSSRSRSPAIVRRRLPVSSHSSGRPCAAGTSMWLPRRAAAPGTPRCSFLKSRLSNTTLDAPACRLKEQ